MSLRDLHLINVLINVRVIFSKQVFLDNLTDNFCRRCFRIWVNGVIFATECSVKSHKLVERDMNIFWFRFFFQDVV